MATEKDEQDPRELIFPNWYDLSIKIHGYETKGQSHENYASKI